MTCDPIETSPRRAALRGLVSMLWRQPLWSIPFALFFGVLFGNRMKDYILCYEMALIFSYCIGLGLWTVRYVILPRVYGSADPLAASERWTTGFWFMGGATVTAYIAAFIIHKTIFPGFLGSPRAILTSGMFTLLFSTLFGGISSARVFYRQAIDRARAVEAMRAELAEAELRALRAQINPHFLFNTLNSIASLIGSNPAAAEDTTTRLAEIFRYALNASDRGEARFADELQFLRDYLEIERTRFGDRLRVTESIEPGLDSVLVPSLLLQPLVENAVHYSVSPRANGGSISIAARRANSGLEIEIQDDGPGFDPAESASGSGFGLRSVRERLRAAGLDHALEIDSLPGRGTRVRITLPLDGGTPARAIPKTQGASS